MAAHTATSFTDKVLVSGEVAEFSPAVIDEMKMHVAKYPPERSRSALIPLLFVVQRERGDWLDNPGINFLAKFLNLEVTDVWETATFYSMFNLRPIGYVTPAPLMPSRQVLLFTSCKDHWVMNPFRLQENI